MFRSNSSNSRSSSSRNSRSNSSRYSIFLAYEKKTYSTRICFEATATAAIVIVIAAVVGIVYFDI